MCPKVSRTHVSLSQLGVMLLSSYVFMQHKTHHWEGKKTALLYFFHLNIAGLCIKLVFTLIVWELRASDQSHVPLSGLWEEPGTPATR